MASMKRALISVSDKTGVVDMAKGSPRLARKSCPPEAQPKRCATRASRSRMWRPIPARRKFSTAASKPSIRKSMADYWHVDRCRLMSSR